MEFSFRLFSVIRPVQMKMAGSSGKTWSTQRWVVDANKKKVEIFELGAVFGNQRGEWNRTWEWNGKKVIFKSRGPPHSRSHKYSIQTSIFTMLAAACSIDHRIPRIQLFFFLCSVRRLQLSLSVRRVCINISQLNIEIWVGHRGTNRSTVAASSRLELSSDSNTKSKLFAYRIDGQIQTKARQRSEKQSYDIGWLDVADAVRCFRVSGAPLPVSSDWLLYGFFLRASSFMFYSCRMVDFSLSLLRAHTNSDMTSDDVHLYMCHCAPRPVSIVFSIPLTDPIDVVAVVRDGILTQLRIIQTISYDPWFDLHFHFYVYFSNKNLFFTSGETIVFSTHSCAVRRIRRGWSGQWYVIVMRNAPQWEILTNFGHGSAWILIFY